jgi:hypothetical protein
MNPIEREQTLDRVARRAGSMGIDAVCGYDSPRIIYANAELYRMMLREDPAAVWDEKAMGFGYDCGKYDDKGADAFLRSRALID